MRLKSESKSERKMVIILLLLSCVMIYGYLIGSGNYFIYLDVGSDTMHSFYPIYRWAAARLKSGDLSFWSFEIGLGGNIFNYTSVVMDPFAWPVIVIGAIFGTQTIAGMLVWMQVTKVLLCGVLCLRYLRYFRVTGPAAVAASYVYALNGFLMLWGQHYWLGTASVWILLFLIFLEEALQNRKYNIPLALVTAMLLMQSVYQGYMVLLFGVVYGLLRVWYRNPEKGFRGWFKSVWPPIWSVFTGALGGMVTFLPTAFLILGSGRLGEEMSVWSKIRYYLTQPYSKEELKGILYRFLSNSAQGTAATFASFDNYYEVAQLFFSVLFLPTAAVWVWKIIREQGEKRKKWSVCLAVVLIVFLIGHPLGSLIFNAFAYPFGRYTFVLMPVFAVAFAKGLEVIQRKQVSAPVLFVTSAATILGCVKCYRAADDTVVRFLMAESVVCVCFFAVLSLYRRYSKREVPSGIFRLGCLILLAVNMTCDGFVTTNVRGLASKNISWVREDDQSDVKEALAWIRSEDDSFYRVEKTFQSISEVMDSVALQYEGVAGYNSMLGRDMQEFYLNIWPDIVLPYSTFRQYFTQVWQEWPQASLCGVKYLLAEEKDPVAEPYIKIGQIGSVVIYKNMLVESPAFVVPEKFTDDLLSAMSYEERVAYFESISADPANRITLYRDGDRVTARVEVEKACKVVLAIPYEVGWCAQLDGKNVSIQKAFYGFMSVSLEAGVHEIVLEYIAPFAKEGAVLSALGFVLMAGTVLMQKKGKKKNFWTVRACADMSVDKSMRLM